MSFTTNLALSANLLTLHLHTYNFKITFSPGPETKNLKKLVRDIIDPSRILGHVDRAKSSEHDPPPTGSYSYEMNAQLNAAQAPKALAANEDDRFSGNQEEKGKLGIGEERHIVEPAQEQGQGNEDGRACEDCD